MRFLLLALLSVLCIQTILHAQTYDISQYRARYERRPFLEIDPGFSYRSFFTEQENADRHDFKLDLDAVWREQSNRDHRIQDVSVISNFDFSYNAFENPDFEGDTRFGASLIVNLDQTDYLTAKRFWGLRGSLSFLGSNVNNSMGGAFRRRVVTALPGIYFGTGRIEFAQDALLANWMMDDLLDAGGITSATPEQREALARRITSIIGNRTFDFRRRRIYELQQLKAVFAEENITTNEDFLLFAVLNDNWAFANRATLPNGRRWQFGVDGGGEYTYRNTPQAIDEFFLSGRPYIRFEHAAIKRNSASSIWSVELGGAAKDYSLDNQQITTTNLEYEFSADLRIGYDYVWLPTSRTSLRWTNRLTTVRSRQQFDNQFVTRRDFQTYLLNSGVVWEYLVAYNWRFRLSGGINGDWQKELSFTTTQVRPYLLFSTNYAIF